MSERIVSPVSFRARGEPSRGGSRAPECFLTAGVHGCSGASTTTKEAAVAIATRENEETLLRSYQQPDAETVKRVVLHPRQRTVSC
jgi:hypothetical protein